MSKLFLLEFVGKLGLILVPIVVIDTIAPTPHECEGKKEGVSNGTSDTKVVHGDEADAGTYEQQCEDVETLTATGHFDALLQERDMRVGGTESVHDDDSVTEGILG